uniref:transcriptional regulator n=1 Tax=Streptococcus pluranimalium TaxID=82348 RepID=UPI003F68EB9F
MQHIVRNTLENYLQMNNHSAQNDNLSLQAKGLLMVLMSNQDTWRPYIDELSKRSKNGRDAHRSAFEELKEAGYVRIYHKSLGRGRGVQNYPLVSDRPIPENYWEYWKSQVDKELSTVFTEDEDF